MKFDNGDQRNRTQPTDELDRILDAALAKYAAVEPRAGLDGRVLAHLGAAPLRSPRRIWLQWSLVGAVAATAVVAVLAWRSSRVPHPVIANHPPTAVEQPAIQKVTSAPHATGEVAATKSSSVRKRVARPALASRAAIPPKLDQFPSSQPLSTEEIALTRYVGNFPKEARLVAQAQEEYAIETQKIMNDAGSETRPSGFIQQER